LRFGKVCLVVMYGVGDSGEGIGDAGDGILLESGGVTFGGESEIFVSGGFDGGVGGASRSMSVWQVWLWAEATNANKAAEYTDATIRGGSGAGSASAAAF